MKRILVTGGTTFVSKYVAKYFQSNNYEVYVLNRGSKQQIENINLICADRNNLKDCLRDFSFDAIIDVCAYNQQDIKNILDCCNLHYWNSDMDDSDDLFLNYEKKNNTKKDQGTSL